MAYKKENRNKHLAGIVLPVVAGILFGLFTIRPAAAHDPLFGEGPRVMWLNGWGFEARYEWNKALRENENGIEYSAEYGVTPNWTVSLHNKQIFYNRLGPAGLKDLEFHTKYRFYHDDVLGGTYQITTLGAVIFPTGRNRLSSNATDFAAGMAADYEGRRWLVFGDVRYRVNTKGSNQINPGNVFLYDASIGVRPVESGFYKPDVVLMGGLNGQVFGRQKRNGESLSGSAGSRLFAYAGAWITYRNLAIKPGIQIPLYDHLRDNHPRFNFVFSVEMHF